MGRRYCGERLVLKAGKAKEAMEALQIRPKVDRLNGEIVAPLRTPSLEACHLPSYLASTGLGLFNCIFYRA
jgi:hypothetical protein